MPTNSFRSGHPTSAFSKLRPVFRGQSWLPAWLLLLGVCLQLAKPVMCHALPDPAAVDSIQALIKRQLYSPAERLARTHLSGLAPETREYSTTLDLLVEACWRQLTGQPADAESLATVAVALHEKLDGDSSLAVADALTDLGRAHRNNRHWDAARAALERAIALRERIDGTASLSLTDYLVALASVERKSGQVENAVVLQERVLEIRKRLCPPHDRDIAQSQANLALAYSSAGRLGEARRLCEDAVRSYETTEPPDSAGLGQCLIQFCSVLLHLSEWEAAYPIAQRALQVSLRLVPPDHPLIMNCVETIGYVEIKRGRPLSAIERLNDALAIVDRAHSGDSESRARILINLGDAWRQSGACDSAIACYSRAGDLYREVLHDRGLEAEAWWRAGTAHLSRGELAAADSLMARSLARREQLAPPEFESVFANRYDLALVRLLSGRLSDAIDLNLAATRGATEWISMNIASMTETEALKQRARASMSCQYALSALAGNADPPRSADVWDAVIRTRAIVLDELAARRRRSGARQDTVFARLMLRRAQISRELSNLVSSGPQGEATQASLQDLLQRREEVEKELASRNASFERDQGRAGVGLKEVTDALAPGEALVGYVRFDYWDPASAIRVLERAGREHRDGLAQDSRPPTARYAAFVLNAEAREPRFVALGDATRIDAVARLWRELLGPALSGADSEVRARRSGEELRKLIWDPIAEVVGSARVVLLVPDGEINLVNFAALPSGRDAYLVESGPTFHQVTAERDIPSLRVPPGPASGFLAVGDVDFDHRAGPKTMADSVYQAAGTDGLRGIDDCAGDKRRPLAPLPGSLAEAKLVAARWKSVHPDEVTTVLSGRAASETAVLERASSARALHLATHGFFARPCAPRVGPDSDVLKDPLLRSGIALAGANQRANPGPGGDDGLLTAEEIATTDLSSLEWVVLSACETGIGEVTPGEGIYGLRRAVALAGARSMVMSLWKVDDLATQRWMRHLYDARFREHQAVADAVRQASLRTLKEQRAHRRSTSPRVWGAFIATGAWR